MLRSARPPCQPRRHGDGGAVPSHPGRRRAPAASPTGHARSGNGGARLPSRGGPCQVPGRCRITASISSISRGAREIHSTPVAVTM